MYLFRQWWIPTQNLKRVKRVVVILSTPVPQITHFPCVLIVLALLTALPIVPFYSSEAWTSFNPFTAPACKISGLKSAHIHTSRHYIWWSCNKSAFSTVHFGRNPFKSFEQRAQKSLNGFKFGTFIGCFPSDGVASRDSEKVKLIVKGLS